MKNFTSVYDVKNIDDLIAKALKIKANPLSNKNIGNGKRIGLVFLNPSLRTRLSTQIAAKNLGLDSFVLNASAESWQLEFGDDAIMNGTTVEHIKDAAPVLGKYFDILAVRTFAGLKNKTEDYEELILNKFIKYSGVPVISLESATRHPLQSLADLITISELNKKNKPKIVLTWAPHIKALPQAVANSFAEWINVWGKAEFVITHPKNYELDEKFSGNAKIIYNQDEALDGADFIYVKNWSAFKNYGEVLASHENWMIDKKKIVKTNNAFIMHCLPTRRNIELSEEILDSPSSIVTKQAENRIYSAQTIISEILEQNG